MKYIFCYFYRDNASYENPFYSFLGSYQVKQIIEHSDQENTLFQVKDIMYFSRK